jgi:hypothetical protein
MKNSKNSLGMTHLCHAKFVHAIYEHDSSISLCTISRLGRAEPKKKIEKHIKLKDSSRRQTSLIPFDTVPFMRFMLDAGRPQNEDFTGVYLETSCVWQYGNMQKDGGRYS